MKKKILFLKQFKRNKRKYKFFPPINRFFANEQIRNEMKFETIYLKTRYQLNDSL